MNEELIIQAKALGIESIKELNEAVKATKKAVNDAKFGSQEHAAAEQKNIAVMKLKADVMRANQSENSKMMQSYFKLGESIRDVTQTLMLAGAAWAALSEAKDMAELASRVQMLREELEMLGKQGGFNATELIKQMSDAAGGSVTQLDLMQIALRAIRLGNIDLNKMPLIMQKLEHDSKLAGVSAREMFDIFIRGAETGSKKFQVQFGLLLDIEKAQRAYAASVGKTVKDLDDEEKRAVNVKVAFDALLSRQQAVGGEAEKSLESFEKLGSVWEKVKITLGDLIAVPLSKFLLSVALEAAVVAEAFSAVYHTVVMAYKAVTRDWSGATKEFGKISKLGDEIRKQFLEIGDMWTEIERKASKGGAIGGTPGGTPGGLPGASGRRSINTSNVGSVYDDRGLSGQIYSRNAGLVSGRDYAMPVSLPAGSKTIEQTEAERRAKEEAKATNDYLIDPLKSGFSAVASSAQNGFMRMFENVVGGTNSLFQQMLLGFVNKLSEKLFEKAAVGLLKLLGLSGGGDVVASGSRLHFAASGGHFPYGTGDLVMMGEHGAELAQVGQNGFRVFSHNDTRSVMKGNEGMADMASAIASLQNHIMPQSATEMYFAVKRGGKLRGGATI